MPGQYITEERSGLGTLQVLRELAREDANGNPYLAKSESGVVVDANLLTWYNQLSVKPSAQLLADLTTAYGGAFDMSIFDILCQIGGMETEEQALTPIKTTAGVPCTKVGASVIDVRGVMGVTSCAYNTNWIPLTHAVNYTIGSCGIGCYCVVNPTTIGSRVFFGTLGTNTMRTNLAGNAVRLNSSNSLTITPNINPYTGFIAVRRFVDAFNNIKVFQDNVQKYSNGAAAGTNLSDTKVYVTAEFSGGNAANVMVNGILSMFYAGHTNIDYADLRLRQRAFLTARGVTLPN